MCLGLRGITFHGWQEKNLLKRRQFWPCHEKEGLGQKALGGNKHLSSKGIPASRREGH